MGHVPPAPPGVEVEEAHPVVTILLLALVVAAVLDTAVIRDGFGQKTPQCVTPDGATVYWPDRVRVPR